MSFMPFGIQIGPVLLYYFGLILIAALVIGGIFARLRARNRGQDVGLVFDLIIWAVLAGVIAARIFYIVNPPPSVAAVGYDSRWFFAHPFDLQVGPLAIWSGGLNMAGALIGGLLGVIITLFRRRVDRWLWSDILAPAALLGMGVAAWANVVNQQMYGQPTSLPWGMTVLNPLPPYGIDQRFHPTPAYLAIWALISLGIVLWIENQLLPPKGTLLLIAMLIYLPGLFLADFLRVDVNLLVLGMTEMQIATVGLFIIAGLMLFMRRRMQAEAMSDARMQTMPSSDAG